MHSSAPLTMMQFLICRERGNSSAVDSPVQSRVLIDFTLFRLLRHPSGLSARQSLLPNADMSWTGDIEPLLEYYTERTPGAVIEVGGA